MAMAGRLVDPGASSISVTGESSFSPGKEKGRERLMFG